MAATKTGAREVTRFAPPAPRPSLALSFLRMIWEERQISRAELARRADVSRSTVSEIVPGLLATTLVSEAGVGVSSGGRRPIMLEFQDDAFCILGVDLGVTHLSVVLMDLRGRVLAWQHRDYPVETQPDGARALAAELCDACLAAAKVKRDRLLAIGAGVPSPVDPRHPDRLHALALPQWKGKHRLEELGARYGVPVLVDNDANIGALAERWWGAARGIDDFTYIKVGTGVGAGHFVGGRIYRGATGVAGEIGHMTIDLRGDRCGCGNRGCLVTYIGSNQIVDRFKALAAEPGASTRVTTPAMHAIEDAALADDPLAMRVVHDAAEYLGVAIAGILNLMNPTAVIIGGGLSRLGDRLLLPLRAAVVQRTFAGATAASEIHVSPLGERGVAIGAATLVLDAIFEDPGRFPAIGAIQPLVPSRS